MAKSFHLKEIIDYEISNPRVKPRGDEKRNAVLRPASRRKFLPESTIWKTVLQMETVGEICFD